MAYVQEKSAVAPKRFLAAGATGYIGRRLVSELVAQGC